MTTLPYRFGIQHLQAAAVGRDETTAVWVRVSCWAVAILFAGVRAWASRNYLQSSDAISYLDLAGHFGAGNLSQVINAYWSPLYPILLGVAFRVLSPSPYWEFTVAHAVNFLIYVAAFGAFDFLLQQLRDTRPAVGPQNARFLRLLDDPLWLAASYTVFLYCEMTLSGLQVVTPDVLMGVFFLIGTGNIVRVCNGKLSWTTLAGIGFAWGAGYLAKAVMLPLGCAFLVIVALCSKRKRVRACFITAATAALIAGPWVWALSNKVGHFSTGSSGTLNYAWFVNGIWFVNGAHGSRGACPTAAAERHAPKKIFDDPDAFEFAAPITGTYPPWDDPAYWNDGLRPHFNMAQEIKRITVSGGTYVQLFLRTMAPITTTILILTIVAVSRVPARVLVEHWPLLLVAIAGFLLYAGVYADDRFFGTISAVFWLALISSIALPRSEESRLQIRTAAVALIVVLGIYVFADTIGDLKGRYPGRDHPQWQIAQALHGHGIGQGDAVAVLLDGTWDWARLARVHVVAEVAGAQLDKFWKGSPELQAAVLNAFARAGARAVVAGPLTAPICPKADADPSSEWRPLGSTGYYFHDLPAHRLSKSVSSGVLASLNRGLVR